MPDEACDQRQWLRDALFSVQRVLETQLSVSTGSITHSGVMGAVNENHWIDVFRAYLPNRYAADSAIVIDSRGGVSDQIDIVIYDRQYTPVLLSQQDHRYVPAEAVYAVIEAKPEFSKAYLTYAGSKAASVRRLHRTSVEIPYAGGVYKPRPLFPIAAGLVAAKADWVDGLGTSFQSCMGDLVGDNRLDFGCALAHGAFDRFGGDGLNIFPAGGALIRCLFRLLGHLQTLGTVPAIDWAAYGDVLSAK